MISAHFTQIILCLDRLYDLPSKTRIQQTLQALSAELKRLVREADG
jgi:hypothetical protein